MLNRNQFPINVFFGFNFTERLGVEVGYGETRRSHKTVTLGPGDRAPGHDLIEVGQYQVYDTSVSISQPYLSLKYTHPINDRIQLFGAVGATMIKLTGSWDYVANQNGPTMHLQRVAAVNSLILEKQFL